MVNSPTEPPRNGTQRRRRRAVATRLPQARAAENDSHWILCTVGILAQGRHWAVAVAKERSQQLRMAEHELGPLLTLTQHGHELWGATLAPYPVCWWA